MGAPPALQRSPDPLDPGRGAGRAAHGVGEQPTVAVRAEHMLRLRGETLLRGTSTAAARDEHQALVAAGLQDGGAGVVERYRGVAVLAGAVEPIEIGRAHV